MSRSDMFGLNSYSWCGSESSFQIAGYDTLVSYFSNSTIPVFFSEYGCNDPTPRLFDEVPVLYGPNMTALSGGLVYEWTLETSNYGLVRINDNGSTTLLGDFDRLQSQFDKLNITLITTQNETATNLQPPRCSSDLINSDGFSKDFDIPSAPQGAADLISNGISDAPTGRIVSVTRTSVELPVFAANGAPIRGLAIRPAAGANEPGGGSGFSTSSPGATPSTSTKKGAAAQATAGVYSGAGAIAAAVFGVGVMVL